MNTHLNDDYETKKKLSDKLREKYRDRVPVIINSNKLELERTKFLPSKDSTFGQFMAFIIKSYLNVAKKESVLGFVNNKLIPVASTLGEIYSEEAHYDGFLYIDLCKENVFG